MLQNSIVSLIKTTYAILPWKQKVFEGLRRCRLPQSIYRHLHFEGCIDIAVGKGAKFRMHHFGYQIENEIFWGGYGGNWEATSLRIWAILSRKASTILDIGANTGVYALAAKAVNEKARVIAFEPLASACEKLRWNIELNNFDIDVIECAASNTTGYVTFFQPKTGHAYSASLEEEMVKGLQLDKKMVAATRVDDFARSRSLHTINLIKIDVEMHEQAVLIGLGDLLRSTPTIMLEVLNPELGMLITEYLRPYGYKFFRIAEGKGVFPTRTIGDGEHNYIACAPEVAVANGFIAGVAHIELRP